MRYFLYVSRTKVEMLHSQIGSSYFGKLKAGVKLKIPFVEASLDSETEARAIYNKAEEIRTYLISKAQVGPISKPKSYVDDVAELSFGNVVEYASSIAYFGGSVDGKKVALIGSTSSLVGGVKSEESNFAPFYYTMKFINDALDRGNDLTGELPYVKSLEQAVDIAQAAVTLPPERVAFTAMVLHDAPNLLVATPIFVARAD